MTTIENKSELKQNDDATTGVTEVKKKSGNAFIRFLSMGGFIIFIILGAAIFIGLSILFKW